MNDFVGWFVFGALVGTLGGFLAAFGGEAINDVDNRLRQLKGQPTVPWPAHWQIIAASAVVCGTMFAALGLL
jgi:hypothetical protein